MYDLYIMDTFDTFPGKNRYGGLKYSVDILFVDKTLIEIILTVLY